MTRITKLEVYGFKSFAKKTELLFGDKFNCILGPNGSGKCVTGDTKVHLADGRLISIRKLYDEKEKTNDSQKIDDGIIVGGDNTEIICLNTKTLKNEKRKIKAFVKRSSPDTLLQIQTKSGRSITSTPYHPLFILKNNSVVGARADELKTGTRIAVPRKINVTPLNNTFFELIDLIEAKEQIYVPFSENLKQILRKNKNQTWAKIIHECKIPYSALKGFFDKQSINFSYLIKLLRYFNFKDQEITETVSHIKSKNGHKIYPMIWQNSKEFSKVLGYLLAEGHMTRSNQIWFTNGTPEVVEDYALSIKKVFNETPSIFEYKPNCWDVIIYSSPIKKILSKFGMPLSGGTKNKFIPSFYMAHSSDSELSELLNGLYSGDGYVSNTAIEITTKSKKLANNIQTILTRLGILNYTRDVIKVATNNGFCGRYKSISVYGVLNMARYHSTITLSHPEKQQKIKNNIVKKPNPNDDLIDVNELVKMVTQDQEINIKTTKKSYPKLDAYCYNQCTPSRNGVQELIQKLFLSKQATKQLDTLKKLAYSDIFWDKITSIKEVKNKEEWVYDLCVDEHHNFIANNIFVHNSNVLDAICFVLGRSSSKSLRVEKSANLIYNGGKTKKPSDEAIVSICFDNSKKVFPIDGEELKITRIVKQNGQSTYKMNDKKVTRNEILEMLSRARIDPDGYNIILQGDIIHFVEMPTIERRQIVEEIAGISQYEDKKQKAMLELEKVENKLNEAAIVLTERKTYLNELKKERDQALKYKELKDRVKENKATYTNIKMKAKEAEKNTLQEEITKKKEKLDEINQNITKLKDNVILLKSEVDAISKEIEEKGEKEQVSLHKEVESLKIKLATDETRVNHCQTEIEKIKKRKEQLSNELKEHENKIKELNSNKTSLEKENTSKEKELKLVTEKLRVFKEKNKIDSVSEIEKEIEELDSQIDLNQNKITELQKKNQDILREKDRIEYQIQTIDEKIAKIKNIEDSHRIQLEQLKQKKTDYKNITLELNNKLNEDSSNALKLKDLRHKYIESNEQLVKLQAKNDAIMREALGDEAIREVLSLKKTQDGIYGTVSELGNVNNKYALALEIAAGGKLKSVVVSNDTIAANCIKHVKDRKKGIITLLPLNKIKPYPISPELSKLKNQPGVHGFAIDLVTYEPMFKNVFSYVLEDALVVDNIDVARKIGVGNAKMVTLDGDLTLKSGAMRGGFNQRSKGLGFKEKELSNDINELQEKVSNYESLIQRIEKQQQDSEEIIVSLRKKKAELEAEIIKEEKSLHLESGEIEGTDKTKINLGEELKRIDNTLSELQKDISTVNRTLADAKIKKQTLRNKIGTIKSPTLVAELIAFEDSLKKIKNDIQNNDNLIQNIGVQLTNIIMPELEKVKGILKEQDREILTFNEEITKLTESIKSDSKILKEKENKSKEFYAKYKELFKKRQDTSDKINLLERKIEDLRDDSRSIEIKMNNVSLEHARVFAEYSGLEAEFKQYEGVQLNDKTETQLKHEIEKFERMAEDIGSVNLKALEIYESVEKEYNSLIEKKELLIKEKEDVLIMMNEIEGKKKELFLATLNVVNDKFKNFFTSLSTKGEAFLKLENEEKPFEAGLEIMVRLTGTRFLDIRSLSGGEKTLTALAFIFAVQEHQPHTFYVLDEVDAALDKHNSEKLAKLVRKYCDKAQYVVISHNDSMISEADSLFGVSLGEHAISKITSLRL